MFIIDATSDVAGATARLARLMFNIERGAKVYDWSPGGSPDPLPSPEPGFLSVEVPGVSTRAPPVVAEYRPSVGYVYYAPGTNARTLTGELEALFRAFPDEHLTGHLPVEAVPHATLFHQGRTRHGAEVATPRVPHSKGWSPREIYPARRFNTIRKIGIKDLPSHISYGGGFSWYVIPVTIMMQAQQQILSFKVFNAVVAGVFFDTLFGGKESPAPVYRLTPGFFGIPPLPQPVERLLAWPDRHEIILVYVGGRFEPAGACLFRALPAWRDPVVSAEGPPPLAANVALPGIRRVCGFCGLPLWGDVYAITGDPIAPHHMAVCRWCCGCLLLKRLVASAVKVPSGLTLREAYSADAHYACLLPLLEAEAEQMPTRGASPCFFLKLEGGGEAVLEAGERTLATPPCASGPPSSATSGSRAWDGNGSPCCTPPRRRGSGGEGREGLRLYPVHGVFRDNPPGLAVELGNVGVDGFGDLGAGRVDPLPLFRLVDVADLAQLGRRGREERPPDLPQALVGVLLRRPPRCGLDDPAGEGEEVVLVLLQAAHFPVLCVPVQEGERADHPADPPVDALDFLAPDPPRSQLSTRAS